MGAQLPGSRVCVLPSGSRVPCGPPLQRYCGPGSATPPGRRGGHPTPSPPPREREALAELLTPLSPGERGSHRSSAQVQGLGLVPARLRSDQTWQGWTLFRSKSNCLVYVNSHTSEHRYPFCSACLFSYLSLQLLLVFSFPISKCRSQSASDKEVLSKLGIVRTLRNKYLRSFPNCHLLS